MTDMHPRSIDTEYLLKDQYKTANNLQARANLHVLFSVNKYGWHRWVFDQFEIPAAARIIEFGTGPSWLWAENLDRIPGDWHITITDFSPGMLEESKRNLANSSHSFKHEVIDVQSIPYPDASFDAVIANHMLYHVPDLKKALSEMRRVLKPTGKLYTATNGQHHLREMFELQQRFDPQLEYWTGFSAARSFELDKGVSILSEFFPKVVLRRYEDALNVTEAEPLVAFMLSGFAKAIVVGERLDALREFVQREIDTHGAIRITKDPGMLISSLA
jgi:ubiquinone/menaquinone biosynthesis C-methylase UbiE